MKPLTFAVLRLLSDGVFHSGEDMARQLNISRASIWQAMRNLDEAGVDLFRVPGRGYRLREPLNWIDKDKIYAGLGDKAGFFDLEVADSLASTNSRLLEKSVQGAPHGSCVITEMQTAGRGRRGREWHANLGGSLTFSLLWRFNQGAGFLSGLSLAVGVALMRALNQAGVPGAGLKWPNDVLHQHRKLAGILIELQGDMLGPSAAVIGIGINLKLSSKVLNRIDQAVVDIHSIGGKVSERNLLLANILLHLADVLNEFDAGGFSILREEWLKYHAYQEKQVLLMLPDGNQHEGYLLDVADDGALLVRTAIGKQRFTSGEISLRTVA
ncbi:biotin/acetyl-CoA-carboxylase ligase [Sulfuricella denitrificans skB26]|uniref:Bifunctional ligase/repressor BirA n=1 Tax=Sulfuricella denitrificans (strain DSM 22764 / NBRC 105220 / skB26) TaxID=1163617 RepID=S6AAW8_SULDS|nr:biotin/acetyl-CoA-carboxylase ligase [Sulfuricella denitrificans skB26]